MPYLDHLYAAIRSGDLNRLVTLLRKNPSMIDAVEENGINLLHYAVLLERVEIVIYLINNAQCPIEGQEKHYGHTPLHIACLHNMPRIAQHLLSKLTAQQVNIQDKHGWTGLHHASRNGNLELCKLLVKSQCAVQTRNKLGKTALHYAAQHGFLDILKFLYDYVTDVVTPSLSESSVLAVPSLLHMATLNNSTATVEWLMAKYYPPNIKCKRLLHEDGTVAVEEFAEDTAGARGHSALRGSLSAYRQSVESWISDFIKDYRPLDRAKLCLVGPAKGGKTALKDALGRDYLQSLRSSEDEKNSEEPMSKRTIGISVSSLSLSGREPFKVWDFASDVQHYVTHQFFVSSESTAYVVVLDLSGSVATLESELVWWLEFISMRNLGAIPFHQYKSGADLVPLKPLVRYKEEQGRPRTNTTMQPVRVRSRLQSASSTLTKSLLPVKPTRSPSHSMSHCPLSSSTCPTLEVSTLTPIPVLVVGTHADVLSGPARCEKVLKMEDIIRSKTEHYKDSLFLVPRFFAVNCLKSRSSEMKTLKEQLGWARAAILEGHEYLYPRIFEKVASRIELLKLKSPDTKLIGLAEMHQLINAEVNALLSEAQLMFILRCLHSTGMLVYIDQGNLNQTVFIDPAWLCHHFLGHALAPRTCSNAVLSHLQTHVIPNSDVAASLGVHAGQLSAKDITDTLTAFELCCPSKERPDCLVFPCLVNEPLPPDLWTPDARYAAYIGRRLICSLETAFIPPGFFSRLQVQAMSLLSPRDTIRLFRYGVAVDAGSHQCLVLLPEGDSSRPNAIDLIGRHDGSSAQSCLHLLDHIQNLFAKLSRHVCPSVFFKRKILSASDLKSHSLSVHAYSIDDVLQAEQAGDSLRNPLSGANETVTDLLFFGQEALREKYGGRRAKVAYLSSEIISKLEILLAGEDGQPGWKELANHINLSEYVHLLGQYKNPVQMLLLKWGEKPRWTVDSLLFALQEIECRDAFNLLRVRMDPKYKMQDS